MSILEKLEWNKITDEVKNFALTQSGKILSDEIPFFDDINKIEYELNLTDEAVKLTNSMLVPPINSMLNIEEIFYQAKLNRILSEDEILETIKCLKTSRLIKNFFSRNSDVAPELSKITINLFEDKEFEDKILELFAENGQLKNDATPELKSAAQIGILEVSC